MKIFRLAVLLFIACGLYYTIVAMIATGLLNEATYNFQMGTVKYTYAVSDIDRIKGDEYAKEGERLKKKGENTLLWIPKIIRP